MVVVKLEVPSGFSPDPNSLKKVSRTSMTCCRKVSNQTIKDITGMNGDSFSLPFFSFSGHFIKHKTLIMIRVENYVHRFKLAVFSAPYGDIIGSI